MTYTEAKTEFNIRLYQWAKLAQQQEIQDSFPSFQLCSGPSKSRNFFQQLNSQEQLDFTQGRLQQRHETATEALGEVLSERSKEILRRFEDFCLRADNRFGDRASTLEMSDNKPKHAKHRELKKRMAAHFQAIFGNTSIASVLLDKKEGLTFGFTCHGWLIKTHFDFGRWYPEITHEHNVWTGKWITPEQPQVLPYNSLGFRLSYGYEIGFGSGWRDITDEDIEPTCAAVVDHCRRMFDVFPLLLQGLDLELLTT